MSAKYKSPSFLLPNELNTNTNPLNTDGNPATGTGINSLYSMNFGGSGSSQKIDVGILPMDGNSEYSISIWFYYFKPSGSLPAMQLFGNRDSSNAYRGVGFEFGNSPASTGVPVSYFYCVSSSGSGANSLEIPAETFNANKWNHLCIVKDATTINAYVNTQSPISVNSTRVFSSTASFKIGTDISSYYNNKIDEVAIFNRALNTTEIAALYDGTGSNIRPSNLMASNLGPIAYYPLGEQAQNSGYPSATGNEWQFPNGVLQDYVMDFENSSNQYISGSASLPNSDYTISAWINLETLTTEGIVSWGELGVGKRRALIIWNGGGSGAYRLFSSTYNSNIGGSTTLATGQWYHVAVTVSSAGVAKIYLNGSQDGTGTNTLNAFTSTDFYIGRTPTGEYFDGKISNVQIFNSVIPGIGTNSIETLYNNGSPLTDMSGFTSLTNWWKLNADSVYTPSAPNYTTALDFVSSESDYISFATGSTIARTQSLTLSAWVNNRNGTIMGNRSSSNYGVSLYFYYNSLIFQLGDGSNNSFNSSVVANVYNYINNGEWSHIAATWDGTTSKVYINNIERNSWTPSYTLTISGWNDFGIGKRAGSNSGYMNGQISNCAVWDKALSSSQVSTLFNFGTPETNISFDPTTWWKLDDQNAITDSSGNGHTGTNNGATNSPGGVAYVPSWKIPSALPIPTVNYTSALEFNRPTANNEYVDIGTISFLNQAGDFTISQWVYPDTTVGVHNMPIQFGTRDFIYLTSNAWQYEFRGGQRQYVPTNGVPVPEKEWIHIALTVEGTVSKFYQNGDLKHTGVAGTTYSANAVRIGNYYSLAYPWYGQISNTALFDSALIDSDIDTLYNNGQPEATPSFSPLHWWKLDNTTTGIQDSIGSSNGTLVQTSTPGAEEVATNVYAGNIPVNGVSTTLPSTALQQSDLQFDSPYSNYSLSFDGAGDYIDTNYTFPAINTWSYSYWVNITDPSNNNYFYHATARNSSTTGLIIWSGDGSASSQRNFSVRMENSATMTFSVSSFNTWYHIVVTGDGSNLTAYVDGSQAATVAASTLFSTLTYTTKIGSNKDGTNYFLNGKIDETAIFNTALTAAQVLEIYNNGKPGDLDNFSGTAPISWWRLGENAYFNTGTTPGPEFTVPNSIAGAPSGVGSGTVTTMISADAPGTYANGIGDGLAITDRVGDAPLSVANSQSYNMIPDDKVPYVPGYVGAQVANTSEMTFDGVDDYFDAGNDTSLQITGNLTISMWFKTTATTGYLISDTPAIGGCYSVLMGGGNGQLWARRGNGANAETTQKTSNAYNDGEWHNIVFVSDSTMRIYIDGVLDVQSTVSTPSSIGGTTTVKIGDGFSNFAGQIDEVAIFDEALTADQIKFDLYEPTTIGKTADIENNTNLPTPVAWYRMGD